MTTCFYDGLAESYHLLFEDWYRTLTRQAAILGPLLQAHTSLHPLKILDCACGIGTQALGFAAMGHRVVASGGNQPGARGSRSAFSQNRFLRLGHDLITGNSR